MSLNGRQVLSHAGCPIASTQAYLASMCALCRQYRLYCVLLAVTLNCFGRILDVGVPPLMPAEVRSGDGPLLLDRNLNQVAAGGVAIWHHDRLLVSALDPTDLPIVQATTQQADPIQHQAVEYAFNDEHVLTF